MGVAWDNGFVVAAKIDGTEWLVRAMQAGALAKIAGFPASAGRDAGMQGAALRAFDQAYDEAQALHVRPDGGWEAVAGYILPDGEWVAEPVVGDGHCHDPRVEAEQWLADGMTEADLAESASEHRRIWAISMHLWECGVVARLCGAGRDSAERIDPEFRPAWLGGWDFADRPCRQGPISLHITAKGWTFG